MHTHSTFFPVVIRLRRLGRLTRLAWIFLIYSPFAPAFGQNSFSGDADFHAQQESRDIWKDKVFKMGVERGAQLSQVMNLNGALNRIKQIIDGPRTSDEFINFLCELEPVWAIKNSLEQELKPDFDSQFDHSLTRLGMGLLTGVLGQTIAEGLRLHPEIRDSNAFIGAGMSALAGPIFYLLTLDALGMDHVTLSPSWFFLLGLPAYPFFQSLMSKVEMIHLSRQIREWKKGVRKLEKTSDLAFSPVFKLIQQAEFSALIHKLDGTALDFNRCRRYLEPSFH